MERPKTVILKDLHILVQWPIWTFISVVGSMSLLVLNFTEYQLGAQLELSGMVASDKQTANILGALQLAVKIHDYTLVSSIFRICQQWVHGYLTGDGILLGLMGAEEAVARPSFIVSKGYKSAVMYAFSGLFSSHKETSEKFESKANPDELSKKNMRFLAVLLFFGCVVSSLAGPASGILMIPHIHWYLDEIIDFNHPEKYSESKSFNLMPITDHPSWLAGREYPDIQIGTGFDVGRNHSYETNPFIAYPELITPGLLYWNIFATSWRTVLGQPADHHRVRLLRDFAGDVYINTTTSFNRELDGNWNAPGTIIKTAMRYDVIVGDRNITLDNIIDDVAECDAAKKSFRRRKYVMEVQGLDASAVCRGRKKHHCTDTQFALENDSPWCYRSVGTDAQQGVVQSSENLLLLIDYERNHPRVWITEGPRAQNNRHFSPSIEVILEKGLNNTSDPVDTPTPWPPEIDLIVCSMTAALQSATASGYDHRFSAQELQFSDNVSGEAPRGLLFHENWLDRAFNYFGTINSTEDLNSNSTRRVTKAGVDRAGVTRAGVGMSGVNRSGRVRGGDEGFHGIQEGWSQTSSVTVASPDNFQYPLRNSRTATNNTALRLFAKAARNSIPPNGVYKGLGFDASQPEIVVGCAFVYALSWIQPSDWRYSALPSMLPDELKPVSSRSVTSNIVNRRLEVFKERYGFRMSTITGVIAAIVLVAHAILTVVATVVHLIKRRSIINAWNSVAEYTALGVGSQYIYMADAFKNTCGGITTFRTLQTLVKVRAKTPEHLEIVLETGLPRVGSGVYGFLDTTRAVVKEKMD